ncbi:carotenoid ester lipase-like protein precursor [Paraphoma chrysanthemicola]|uniref:Carboxylic ester hydrolase n=1 Tax=Paraphoma chrysanthemicola TaxID=798071 RepID=A0A8K0RF11_9PLEO|nr:carotenoid ester lipase-like protein precursor [Paraphoma chrysanthemicola]
MTNISAKFLLWLVLGQVATAHTLRPIVKTTNGTLVGVWNAQYQQDFFLGIPYAQPPTGNLRYARPKPIDEPWRRRNATEFGPWCHSAPLPLPVFEQSGFPHEENEDCLTLNIVRPAGIHRFMGKLPVLFYLPGGGYQEGSGGDQRYNMSFLVQESVKLRAPIIGITINYRISGFGFLSGSDILRSGVANLGLYDQRLALGWIQDNIAAFGGDPSRVTLQGESAGAVSVGHHFRAFGGRDDGLFRAGIAQSGNPASLGMNPSIEEQDTAYNQVLEKVGCSSSNDTISCLREAPVDALKGAFQGLSYFPVLDGDIITEHPFVALSEGRFVQRPIIVGSNTNEGTSFAISENFFVNTTAQFRSVIARYLDSGLANTTIDAVAAEYLENLSAEDAQTSLGTVLLSSRPEYGALYGRASLFRGDQLFIATRRLTTKMWAKHGIPAYSYRFDTVPNGVPPDTLGVTHFAEIPFVFRNIDGVGHASNFLASNSWQDRREYVNLSYRMSRMWISFVNELSPNAPYGTYSHVP